jgi:dephospho-CoA kinase
MANPSNRLTVGLTGGIGSGKSAASLRFKELGAHIIDTDLISHELTAPQGQAINAIAQQFGDAALNNEGGLNRAYMRSLIFNDETARQKLENILHPLIQKKAITALDCDAGPYNVLVVPLLTEKPTWQQHMQTIVLIDCTENLQIQRVAQRNQLPETLILQILQTQASRDERIRLANHIVHNNGSLQSLYQQIDNLHLEFTNVAITKYKK